MHATMLIGNAKMVAKQSTPALIHADVSLHMKQLNLSHSTHNAEMLAETQSMQLTTLIGMLPRNAQVALKISRKLRMRSYLPIVSSV